MLCGDVECGCALTSGNIGVTGSGIPGDPWVLTANDLQVVSVATMPSSPSVGNQVYQFDTGRFLIYDGSNWVIYAGNFPQVFAGHVGGTQTIPANTFTPVVWNEVSIDQGGFTAPSTDTFTIPAGLGGRYHWSAALGFDPSTDGGREVDLQIGDNAQPNLFERSGQSSAATGGTAIKSAAKPLNLSPGATLRIRARVFVGDRDVTSVQHSLVMYEHHPEWEPA